MARDGSPEFGPGDEPGAPGPVPAPDHSSDIPAAPSTNPPEPPVVPSESAIADFWNSYGSVMILVAAGLLIVAVILMRFEG
jgi:hypothetical protein